MKERDVKITCWNSIEAELLWGQLNVSGGGTVLLSQKNHLHPFQIDGLHCLRQCFKYTQYTNIFVKPPSSVF